MYSQQTKQKYVGDSWIKRLGVFILQGQQFPNYNQGLLLIAKGDDLALLKIIECSYTFKEKQRNEIQWIISEISNLNVYMAKAIDVRDEGNTMRMLMTRQTNFNGH